MMSIPRAQSRRQTLVPSTGGGSPLARIVLLIPALGLVAAVLVLVFVWRGMFADAVAGRPAALGEAPLVWTLALFVLTSAGVLVVQAGHGAARVAGPEYRLRQALRRIRGGDFAFRVQLRRGDPLGGLASECNLLLDWLAERAPERARIADDVVDLVARERRAAPVAEVRT
jgi:hypothetical protein